MEALHDVVYQYRFGCALAMYSEAMSKKPEIANLPTEEDKAAAMLLCRETFRCAFPAMDAANTSRISNQILEVYQTCEPGLSLPLEEAITSLVTHLQLAFSLPSGPLPLSEPTESNLQQPRRILAGCRPDEFTGCRLCDEDLLSAMEDHEEVSPVRYCPYHIAQAREASRAVIRALNLNVDI